MAEKTFEQNETQNVEKFCYGTLELVQSSFGKHELYCAVSAGMSNPLGGLAPFRPVDPKSAAISNRNRNTTQ